MLLLRVAGRRGPKEVASSWSQPRAIQRAAIFPRDNARQVSVDNRLSSRADHREKGGWTRRRRRERSRQMLESFAKSMNECREGDNAIIWAEHVGVLIHGTIVVTGNNYRCAICTVPLIARCTANFSSLAGSRKSSKWSNDGRRGINVSNFEYSSNWNYIRDFLYNPLRNSAALSVHAKNCGGNILHGWYFREPRLRRVLRPHGTSARHDGGDSVDGIRGKRVLRRGRSGLRAHAERSTKCPSMRRASLRRRQIRRWQR